MKSRSIAGFAAAAEAVVDAVAAGDAGAAGGVTGIAGAADALCGVLIVVALSNGGITDSPEPDGVATELFVVGGVQVDGLVDVGCANELADVGAADSGDAPPDGPADGVDPDGPEDPDRPKDPVDTGAPDKPAASDGIAEEVGEAGASGNFGTTIPGGGAATASGSSISSTGRSGKSCWNGDAVGTLGRPGGEASVAVPSRGASAKSDGELLAAGGVAPVEVGASALDVVTKPTAEALPGGAPTGRIAFLVPVAAGSPDVALRAVEEVAADGALAADAGGLLAGTAMVFEVPANVAPARLAAVLAPIGT